MKISKVKFGILIGAMFVFASIAIPVAVFARNAQAVEGDDTVTTSNGQGTDNGQGSDGDQGSDNGQGLQTASGRLEDAKLKLCENRQMVMSNIMARVADRGNRQMLVFDKISERVQAFYADKGYSIANYTELVAAVVATRTEAQTALQTMAQNGQTVDCGGDNPKADVDAFKLRAQTMRGALNEYKAAIKNLIVAIKAAAEDAATTEGTE